MYHIFRELGNTSAPSSQAHTWSSVASARRSCAHQPQSFQWAGSSNQYVWAVGMHPATMLCPCPLAWDSVHAQSGWQVKGRSRHTLTSFSSLPPLITVFPNLSRLITCRGRRSLLVMKQPRGIGAENSWSTRNHRFKQHPSLQLCDSQPVWWRTVTVPVSWNQDNLSSGTTQIYWCSAKIQAMLTRSDLHST